MPRLIDGFGASTESESDVDSWAFDHDYYDDDDDGVRPYDYESDYYVWRKPNTYVLVPKFRELIAEHPEGIRYTKLTKVFFKKFREKLDWTNFGYKTLDELLEVYPDIITVIKKGINRDKWLIVDANSSNPNEAQSCSNTDEYGPIPEPDKSNHTSQPTADWPTPIPNESDFTPKPAEYKPNSRSDECNLQNHSTPKPGVYGPIPKPDASNTIPEPTADRPIPIPDESDFTPKPGPYRPIPKSDESNFTPKTGAYRPIPKPDVSNPTPEPTPDWPFPIPDESDFIPKPGIYRPNPRSNKSNFPPKVGAYRPIPKPDTSNPTPEHTANWPIPIPDESDFTPKPGLYRPIPKSDESNFTPKPGAYRPIPKSDESNFTSRPGPYRPIPEPDEYRTTPHPDDTERSPHPGLESPKPPSAFDSKFIDAVIEEISARLFPVSNFWSTMNLRPIPIPPLVGNTIKTENSEGKCNHSRKHPKGRCPKPINTNRTQSPNDAAGKPSTERSSQPPGPASNPQKLTLNLCRVCYSKPENGAFIHENIGHVHGCYTCARRILYYNNNECPVCLRKVYTVAELFF